MAIKRSVLITCDGPCGTVSQGSTVPTGWTMLKIMDFHNTPGVKTPYKVAALCPKCKESVLELLNKKGYALTGVNEVAPEAVTPQQK